MHINKVKTWNGLRYAIVDEFTSINTKGVKKTDELVVEYNTGSGTQVAIFPFTNEGLAKAKEIQKLMRK